MSLCEFCKENKADEASGLVLKMHKILSRQTIWNVRRTSFQQKTLIIKRCKNCKSRQNNAEFIESLIGIFLFFLVPYSIVYTIKNEEFPGVFMIISFFSFPLYCFITSKKRLLSSIESVNSLFKKGWKLGDVKP